MVQKLITKLKSDELDVDKVQRIAGLILQNKKVREILGDNHNDIMRVINNDEALNAMFHMMHYVGHYIFDENKDGKIEYDEVKSTCKSCFACKKKTS